MIRGQRGSRRILEPGLRVALPAHGFLLLFAAMSTMRVRNATFLLGLVLLAVAAATSGMLVLERLAGFHLPGCGMKCQPCWLRC